MEINTSYHNHTKYSKYFHGKNTVNEMCNEAKKHGFTQFAITDHAPRHIFGILKHKILKQKKEIDDFNAANPDIKILMGLEFNLLNLNGDSDLTRECENALDVKLFGFHKICNFGFKGFFKFWLPNFINKNKMIEKNTDAYINCIKKYKMDLITHPQSYIKLNLKRLAEACVENNCYLELNNRHFLYTQKEINDIIPTGVKFLVSTDAHKITDVNNFSCVKNKIEEYNIPISQIANIDQIPNFVNKYETKE